MSFKQKLFAIIEDKDSANMKSLEKREKEFRAKFGINWQNVMHDTAKVTSIKESVKLKRQKPVNSETDPMEPWSAKYSSPIKEDELNEDGLLTLFIRAKGLDHNNMDGNQKAAYSRTSEFKRFKMHHKMNRESMNEEQDKKDTITFDIPLLIRVLELAREDVKDDMELHRIVERLLDLRHEGTLTMDHYEQISGKNKIKEEVEGDSSNSHEMMVFDYHTKYFHVCPAAQKLYKNIENKVDDDSYELVEGMAKLQDVIFFIESHLKSKKKDPMEEDVDYAYMAQNVKDQIDRMILMITPDMRLQHGYLQTHIETIKELVGFNDKNNIEESYSKKLKKETSGMGERIEELKKQSDNQDDDAHITREAKIMTRAKDPCWSGYRMYGKKMKGGKLVPNCVPEEAVSEGIYGIEDSPMSATNSIKAMESSKAKLIKSLYRKKVAESLYDHEKEDKAPATMGKKPKIENMDDKEKNSGENKPSARIIMSGGKTLTGQNRDTVEIDPMLRNRPGQVDVTKDKDKKKKDEKSSGAMQKDEKK
jgi:hypothetical protein